MGLDNQDPTITEGNNDSIAPDSSNPVDTIKLDEKPSLDTDAINEAVMDAGNNNPNIQNTFDVNDISLNNVPTTQEELDQRLDENPNMSLAGGDSATVNSGDMFTGEQQMNATSIDTLSEGMTTKDEGAPNASFIDGDIIDGSGDSAAAAAAAAAADAALDEKASKDPAHIANTITVPKPKSKTPIFIAIGIVAIIAVIAIIIYIITH